MIDLFGIDLNQLLESDCHARLCPGNDIYAQFLYYSCRRDVYEPENNMKNSIRDPKQIYLSNFSKKYLSSMEAYIYDQENNKTLNNEIIEKGELTPEQFRKVIKKGMIVQCFDAPIRRGANIYLIRSVNLETGYFKISYLKDDKDKYNVNISTEDFDRSKFSRSIMQYSSYTILQQPKRGFMSNLIQRCKEIFLSEPEKSFRKAEITTDDGFLTSEGIQVFMKWLLNKNATEFKKEIVDDIIEDINEKKKEKE